MAVDQGAFAEVDDELGVLAAHHGVEGADGEQGALGVVAAGQVVGVPGEPGGTGGSVVLGGLHTLPEEVGGLEPHQAGAGGGVCSLGGEGACRFLQLVVVGMRGREPEGGVDPLVVGESGHLKGGPQMLDGGGRGAEQCGAAQFVQQVGLDPLARWFLQGAFEAAAGGLRGTDREVLSGCFAELLDQFLVVVGVYFEEVPGGRGGAESRTGDRPGGPAVHGGSGEAGGMERYTAVAISGWTNSSGSKPVTTRASRSRAVQSAASAGLIPARVAARSCEMSVPSTAAAQANRLAWVPSRSSRATSPLPRAVAPSSRSSPADSSRGASSRSWTLATSSTAS